MSPPPESLLGRHPRPCLCPLLSVYSWNHKAHLLSVHLSGKGRTGWVSYTVPLEPGTAHIIISAERRGEEVSFSRVCRPIRCFASPSSSEVLSIFEPRYNPLPFLTPDGLASQILPDSAFQGIVCFTSCDSACFLDFSRTPRYS